MTARATTVGPDESVAFALELMLWGAVHHLPVVRDGKLLGLVSDRDLLSRQLPGGLEGLRNARVRQVMSTEVMTAAPDDDVTDAAARMASASINCLPVVESGRLVGIITSTDILAERGKLLFKSGRGEVPSARTLMTSRVYSVKRDSDIVDAVTLMLEHGVRHLPVLDELERVVGMVSERDLRTALGALALELRESGAGNGQAGTVAQAMTPRAIVVREDASLFEVASHFIHERVGAVPVVDEGERLVGIVSYVDLLRYLLGESRVAGS